jgi:hypothetical protein
MAGDGERRMLFDIRGRRKNVVRVVYAILALLMGGSLFLTVGPFNLSELFGNGSTSSSSEVYEEQVERIEGRLAKEPTNENLLLALTRARISIGAAETGTSLEGENPQLPPEARDEYEEALDAWNRYLTQAGDEPSPVAAQLVAQTFFTLSERGSYSLAEVETNGAAAVRAQRIAAEERPNVNSLSTLALYEFFYGDLEAGDEATKQALATAASKTEAANIKKQLAEFRRRGQGYKKSLEKFAKEQKRTGGGEEALQNPFSGIGSGSSGSAGQ